MTDICSTCSAGRRARAPSSARPSCAESRRRPRGPSRSGGSSLLSSVLFDRAGSVDRFRGSALRRHAAPSPAGLGWVKADPRLLVASASSGAVVRCRRVCSGGCATYYKPGVQYAPSRLGDGLFFLGTRPSGALRWRIASGREASSGTLRRR